MVVSDWDGYRYTVSDGVEGFRVPTLVPSFAWQGEELALQHDHGLLTYQNYVGAVAQHVAVDTEAAAAAIASLAEDPALRQRMGEAGRQTVRQRFDWPVVARLHHQLYAELAEIRCAVQERSGLEAQHPLRGDPFQDFAPFATASLGPETELRLAMPLHELQHRLNNLTRLDRCYGQFHASPADVQRLLVQLQNEQGQSLAATLREASVFKPETLKSVMGDYWEQGRPVGFVDRRKTIVLIRVRNAADAQSLSFEQNGIVAKLRELPGFEQIKKVRFEISPQAHF